MNLKCSNQKSFKYCPSSQMNFEFTAANRMDEKQTTKGNKGGIFDPASAIPYRRLVFSPSFSL